MRNQPQPNLANPSGFALIIWSPVQSLIAESAERENKAKQKLMARCQVLMEEKKELMDDIKTQDAQLTELLARMNRAPDTRKMGLMAAVINLMAKQRIARDARKAKMDDEMMKHMRHHMQVDRESSLQCPMMMG